MENIFEKNGHKKRRYRNNARWRTVYMRKKDKFNCALPD
jgi:hypothetical protein